MNLTIDKKRPEDRLYTNMKNMTTGPLLDTRNL